VRGGKAFLSSLSSGGMGGKRGKYGLRSLLGEETSRLRPQKGEAKRKRIRKKVNRAGESRREGETAIGSFRDLRRRRGGG